MKDETRKKRNEYQKKYKETHKDKYNEYQKKYWAEHGEEINAKRRNRKAYKFRCEKAIEYIENKIEYLKKCKNFKIVFYDEDNIEHIWNEQILYKENELLNILKPKENK